MMKKYEMEDLAAQEMKEKLKKHAKDLAAKAKNATKRLHGHLKNKTSGMMKKYEMEDLADDAPEFSLPTFAGGCLVGMVIMGGVVMSVTRFRARRSARTTQSTTDAEEALVECPE